MKAFTMRDTLEKFNDILIEIFYILCYNNYRKLKEGRKMRNKYLRLKLAVKRTQKAKKEKEKLLTKEFENAIIKSR